MFNKIKAVKDLRDQAKKIQNELDEITVSGEAQWGKVKVEMNGNQKVLSVHIDDEIVGNKGKIEEGLKDAINEATKKLQKKWRQR